MNIIIASIIDKQATRASVDHNTVEFAQQQDEAPQKLKISKRFAKYAG